ncbi:Valyl-tRNA synthetase, partial [Chlamydia pneumoniae B21]
LHLKAFVVCSDTTEIQSCIPILQALGGLESIQLLDKEPEKGLYSFGVVDTIRLGIFVPEEHLLKEKGRLEKERVRLERAVENLERLLGDEMFLPKGKPESCSCEARSFKE